MSVKATDIVLPEEFVAPPRAQWTVNFELTPEEFQKVFEYTVAKATEMKTGKGRLSYAYWTMEQDGGFEVMKDCLTQERYDAWEEACEEAGEYMGESFNDATFRAEMQVFGEIMGI